MKVILVLIVACVALATVCAQNKSTTLEATTPKATSLKATTPKATTPKATTPKATTPKATTPKATTPKATTPKATTPKATTPKATTPKATTPKATTPKATTPKATTPKATTPKATTPKATTPKATTPKATTPKATTPKATTPKPPSIGHFELKVDKKVCIILDSAIEMTVEYEKKNNKKVLAKPFSVPINAKVSGTCSNTSGEMILEFNKNKVEFKFEDADKKANLPTVVLSIFLDEKHFPDAKEAKKSVNFTSVSLKFAQSPDNTFFLCKVGETVKFQESKTTVHLTDLKVQAFNIEKENFTGSGRECPQDNPTTTTPIPTPTPTPTPPPIPVNNYTVDNQFQNVTCIFMRTAMQLQIPYLRNDSKNSTKAIDVPEVNKTKTTGNCELSSDSQNLTVEFFNDWMVTFVFQKEPDSSMLSDDSSFEYELKNLTVQYKVTKELFPDAKEEGNTTTVEVTNLDGFLEANSKGSFLCKSNTNLTVKDGVFLSTSNLQYKAFNTDNSTAFNGDVNECPADSDTNSIVPIAVGAALAGLVVIVLIAYLIGRRRSRRAGYESV